LTLTVIPPIRFAGHEIVEPRRVTAIGAPETATRTLVGTTAKPMLIVDPRRTTTGFPEAAIGAPQVVPQHQDETANRTWPGSP
jgi:hypothetical protein